MKQDVSFSKFINITVKKLSKKDLHKAQCEVLAVAPGSATKDDKKASYSLHKDFVTYKPLLDRLNKEGELSTKNGATCLVRYAGVSGADHLLTVGLGTDKEGLNALGATERLRRVAAMVIQKLAAEKIKTATIHLDSFLMPSAKLALDAATAAEAFAEGAGLTAYHFRKYTSNGKAEAKKEEKSLIIELATFDATRAKSFEKGLLNAKALVSGAEICRDLGNEPSNFLYPEEYAVYAKKLAQTYGLKCTVLDEKTMAKEGMGLLLGVGQGSKNPPRLIVLEYNPAKKAKKTIAFVGKGITFDSGGISIKPSTRMEDMKHDMCGSAAVVGAVCAAAQMKVPARIITVVAAAENMPDGGAICPGHILKARNGKTVEISNTDAEGRLVLADALDYVQDMKPDYIIDLATLTGAAGVTLGKVCAGLMGNDTGFNRTVQAAAKDTAERVWELPLFDEYFDDLKSEYADMRNSGDTPLHGTAKGAMFLKEFIRKGTKWVHLDIAYVAYALSHVPYCPKKSSSGWGVRLLVDLAKKVG